MKKKNTPVIRPNPQIFNKKVGRTSFKGLKHKDGENFTDIEYFELLAKRVEEIEKENQNNKFINYSDYGFDNDCVKVAKQINEALKEGRPQKEIKDFLALCIDFEK